MERSTLKSWRSPAVPAKVANPPDDDLSGRTIIGIPLDSPRRLTSLVLDQTDDGQAGERTLKQNLFKVRLADTDGRRNRASILVKKMYAWRGYKVAWHARQQANRVTLVASHGDLPMATISVSFDSSAGLLVDELYKPEVDELRGAGKRVCEFTKLAVDGASRSKRVLATLFHIAYIYSYRMNNYSDLFIEVNPRHVRFYEQMLGFRQLGPVRQNARVDAPAVLLRLDFTHSETQIAIFGGHPDKSRTEKSLYPYFFSPTEEHGISTRLSKLG